MNIELRKADVNDYSQVYDLIKEFAFFIKTPEKVTITLSQMIEDKDYFHCIVALDGQEIIGFATYYFAYYSWTGKSAYLDDLYVKEKYRGNKIGTKLMNMVFKSELAT